ncbi:ribokinase [Oceaniovalibus sp. ACAM 378]|uniref:ribokinase n=1 Tax=Oceaniovalibus sp. ACAM 378 TaxID=2599923 RepID=UPI0011D9C8A5|nr:ribokinase [Oceaniovalibus sp. ACAM 378]TYB89702.1 ribokinase [Oceaniovalibus sp. ACAM 378]
MAGRVVITGIFAADSTFRAGRLPVIGETILGQGFALGPGGKGSNQAVACARASGGSKTGAETYFITRLGQDTFADMALDLWRDAGVIPAVTHHPESHTGAAFIFLEAGTGNNAIIVCPGAAGTMGPADMDAQQELISGADVFLTQLEQPLDAAQRGLEIAREGGVTTILNPAPAADLSDAMLALCDWITPNESESEALTGLPVTTTTEAEAAARALQARGVGNVIITLGALGVLVCAGDGDAVHLPAVAPGPVVETTGAGDAFNGGFAAALARGDDPVTAARFGCATAGISVTRPGAAASMPGLDEITALLAR